MSIIINNRYRVENVKVELLVGKLYAAYDLKKFCKVLVWLFEENGTALVDQMFLNLDSIPENDYSLSILEKGFYNEDRLVFIIYSYTDVISFSEYFNKETSVHKIIDFSNNLVNAINFFHCNNIIHSRLFPKNILFDQQQLKIMLFGIDEIIKIYQIPDKYSSFISPELLLGENKVRSSDYYAVGTILYYLLTDKYYSIEGYSTFSDLYKFEEKKYLLDFEHLISTATSQLSNKRDIFLINE